MINQAEFLSMGATWLQDVEARSLTVVRKSASGLRSWADLLSLSFILNKRSVFDDGYG